MKDVIKEKLKTKVTKTCDVLVVGGGIAGVSAALAAARQHKKVILAEREFMLGGLATAGLIAIYLPLCDGLGNQVSFGIAEELLRLSVSIDHDDKRGYDEWINHPERKKNDRSPRFEVNFNPQLFAFSMERLLIGYDVEILYGTAAVGASVDKNKIDSVIFENKSGRFAIRAKGVADASGDADIAKFAELPTRTPQVKNTLAAWYYYYGKNGYGLKTLGFCDSTEEKDRKNEDEIFETLRFSGVDGDEVSAFTVASHLSSYNDILRLRKKDDTYVPTTIATIPQMRMSRCIIGESVIKEADYGKRTDDCVGKVADWRKRGKVYDVPLGALYNKKIVNLAIAGRCVSVDDGAWDILRVIPCCAVTGEAAGTALALTTDLTDIDVKVLQAFLKIDGKY